MFEFLSMLGKYAPLISGGVQAASSFMAYKQQKDADSTAKAQATIEARRTRSDAERAALEEERTADKHRKFQKMAYLKSGVLLEGSPLLVMEETRQKGIENAANVRRTGGISAQSIMKAGSIKKASLLNTGQDAAASIANAFTTFQQLKKVTG